MRNGGLRAIIVVARLSGVGWLASHADHAAWFAFGLSSRPKIVGDQEIGEAEPVLQVAQEVEDLRLDRHVEGRGRLVANDEIGAHGDCARDRDALALAAGEFVRKLPRVGSVETDELKAVRRPEPRSPAFPSRPLRSRGRETPGSAQR